MGNPRIVERAVRLMEDAMRFTDETSRLYFTRLSKLAGLREKIGAYESAQPLYLQDSRHCSFARAL